MQILTTALKYTGDGPRHLVRYKVDLCFCGRFFLVSTTATELFFFLFLTPIQHLFFIYIERAMKTTLASSYFIYFFYCNPQIDANVALISMCGMDYQVMYVFFPFVFLLFFFATVKSCVTQTLVMGLVKLKRLYMLNG